MGGNSATKNTSSSPSLLEDSSASRSFFSRLSFLSRSRTRNLTDFHIRPAEPHRKYSAGDNVAGAVVLTVLKPIRITHLTVTLHGFVKVYKGPNAAHEQTAASLSQTASSGGGGGITGRIRYFGNGHASLFQDEQVLSADGKLEAGRYEFNFDLVFPAKGLPSSIDFERGTISYMITATLTRPTAIAATTSCDRKIYLVEQVDIGSLAPPRARTISLEPISRRAKRKRPPVPDRGSTASDAQEPAPSDLESSSRAPESVTEGSVLAADDAGAQDSQMNNPRSPSRVEVYDVMSEVSAESVISGSTGAGAGNRASDPTASSSSASQVGVRTAAAEEKTITASVEMLKGGCLPGDFVPVKVSVQHIKRIKSVHGVIVTLYRQGRIDSAPPISLFTDLSKEEIRRLEKEEYFPRSKTGLSGLSLSSAGSCSVFRKDLSQAFGPLIIDPVTLDASVTISVRVPEDVFPTIKGVPGELISFKYQLEVIVDLGGKLASQIQSGQSKSVGTMSGAGGAAIPSMMRNPYENGSGFLGHWGGSIIDTDQLRRQKGVISVVFEVTVGTLDTSRQRVRGSLRPFPPDEHTPHHHDPHHNPAELQQQQLNPTVALYGPDEKRRPHQRSDFEDEGYQAQPDEGQQYPYMINDYPPSPYYAVEEEASPPSAAAPVYIPPPTMTDEAGLSEKERIRRAEQRLLPSRPPEDPSAAGPSSSLSSPLPPPQPARNQRDDEDLYSAGEQASPSSLSARDRLRASLPLPPPTSLPPTASATATDAAGPSAPTLEDLEPRAPTYSAHDPNQPAEDKLERERRRLLTEASAPPEFPADCDGGGPSSPGLFFGAASAPGPGVGVGVGADVGGFEPSAPVLIEEEEAAAAEGGGWYAPPPPPVVGGVGGASLSLAYRGIASPPLEVAASSSSSPLTRAATAPVEQLPRYER